MTKKKSLVVFFDIETFKYNMTAEPKEQKALEYSVSCKFKRHGEKPFEHVFNTLKDMIDYFLKVDETYIELVAHNGEGYDFGFLRRSLVINYGLVPQNMWLKNSLNHSLEKKPPKNNKNYLLVSRIRSSTRTMLDFRIDCHHFKTVDTLPKTHMSVRTLGKMLEDLKLDENGKNVKLNYDEDYTKYDTDKDMSDSEAYKYSKKIYDQLNEHALDYVMNDTRVIYAVWYNYNKIYHPSYDVTKLTLGQNVLNQYLINDLAQLQLRGNIRRPNSLPEDSDFRKYRKMNLTNYNFGKVNGQYENLYQYLHHYYKGGLNFYNEDKVGKLIHHHIKHMDLNSSYPTVMRYNPIPTFIVDYGVVNKMIKIDRNPKYYYFYQMSKIAFAKIIEKPILKRSLHVSEAITKYLNNNTDCVYFQTPHLKIFEKFAGKKFNELPIISYVKYEAYGFGGLPVIQVNYKRKTELKKQHASAGEVAGTKVPLNSIYGLSALSAFFSLFEYDEKQGKIVSIHDDLGNKGFKNNERNIAFACSVTAWAFYNLMKPLTHAVEMLDKNWFYTDTDSHFITYELWDKIEPFVDRDKYRLGAWDLEHEDITDMYIMNHKKYALYSNDNKKVEVFSGGIPKKAFHVEKYHDLKSFVDSTFHDGVKIKNLKNVFNKQLVTILYESTTEINVGGKYEQHFPFTKQELLKEKLDTEVIYAISAGMELKDSTESESSLYYETPLGSFSLNEIFPPQYKNDLATKGSMNEVIRVFKRAKMVLEKQGILDEIEKQRQEEMELN